MASQRIKRVLYLFIVMIVVAGGAAAYYFGYVSPKESDLRYQAALSDMYVQLQKNAVTFTDIMALPAMNDITADPSICLRNLDRTDALMRRHEALLDQLAVKLEERSALWLYGLSREAARTGAFEERSHSMILQTRQVFDRYASFAKFLRGITDVRSEYLETVREFTSAYDLSIYTGRTELLRQNATTMQQIAKRTNALIAPPELIGIRDRMATLYDEMASGYTDLATGVEMAIEADMDAGAKRIEAAVSTYDSEMPALYLKSIEASRTIKELETLSDKYL